MKQEDFVRFYGSLAKDIGEQTGLDPAVVLGQIGVETGWGDHVMNHNIFGITKPDGSFESYPGEGEAGSAYVNLMKNPRYQPVIKAGPEDQAMAMGASGYAKDRAYGIKLSAARKSLLDAGYGQPTADEVNSMLDAARAKNAPPQAPSPGMATPNEPPMVGNAEDINKLLDANRRPAMTAKEAPPPGVGDAVKNAGGVIKNVEAGAVGGVGDVLDAVTNPGQMANRGLGTAYQFGHDLLAPVFGYDRFTPDQRASYDRGLLPTEGLPNPLMWGPEMVARAFGKPMPDSSHLGTDAVNQLGVPTPQNTIPTNTVERVAQEATRGGVNLLPSALIGGVSTARALISGAAGGVMGGEAANVSPDWAAPGVSLLGNITGSTVGLAGAAPELKNYADMQANKAPLTPRPFSLNNRAARLVGAGADFGEHLNPSGKIEVLEDKLSEEPPITKSGVDKSNYDGFTPNQANPTGLETNLNASNAARVQTILSKDGVDLIKNQADLNAQRIEKNISLDLRLPGEKVESEGGPINRNIGQGRLGALQDEVDGVPYNEERAMYDDAMGLGRIKVTPKEAQAKINEIKALTDAGFGALQKKSTTLTLDQVDGVINKLIADLRENGITANANDVSTTAWQHLMDLHDALARRESGFVPGKGAAPQPGIARQSDINEMSGRFTTNPAIRYGVPAALGAGGIAMNHLLGSGLNPVWGDMIDVAGPMIGMPILSKGLSMISPTKGRVQKISGQMSNELGISGK